MSDVCFKRIVSSRYQVERCRFSPDGNLLAACFSDHSVKVFSLSANEPTENDGTDHAPSPFHPQHPVCCFRGHQSNVWCIDFATDASLLCSCSSDNSVIVWDLHTQQITLSFTGHSDTVWCCSFDREDKCVIASGSSDKTVKVWNRDSGEVIHMLTGYLDAVECLDFSKDGSLLCTGSRDKTIRLWRNICPNGNPVCLLLHATNAWIRFCAFSHLDKDLLATSGPDNAILVWDLQDIQFNETDQSDNSASPVDDEEQSHQSQIDTIAPPTAELNSEENSSVASSSTETEMDATKSVGFVPKLRLSGHLNTVWGCSFVQQMQDNSHKKKDTLISCSGDRTLRFWDLADGSCTNVVRQFRGSSDSQLLTCSFCPSSSLLAVGLYDGALLVAEI